MKPKYIVIIICLAAVVLSSFIAWNMFRVKRQFQVLTNTKLDFCFLVDDRYKLQISDSDIKYMGGKNSGHLELIKSGLSADITKVNINGFEGGYKKIKNKRIYEYKLNDEFIIRDTFVNVEKTIVNLVPYREQCVGIKKNFKNNINIFEHGE